MKTPRVITPKKKAFFGISAVLFSGILMLGLNLILPTVAVFPLMALTEGDFAKFAKILHYPQQTLYLLSFFINNL